MTRTEPKTGLQRLREPFAENQISLKPQPMKRDAPKGKCHECGGYHGLPAIHLKYVGHAALTDRLLECDEQWQWDPLAYADTGLPRLDGDGGLWIRLTVCGITRLGYGDAQGKTGPDAMKERIGDALRNAAMRFGAALDLWHKGDLHGLEDADDQKAPAEPQMRAAPTAPKPALHSPMQPDTIIDAPRLGNSEHATDPLNPPSDIAEHIASMATAETVAALAKIMNGLPKQHKIAAIEAFNSRMTELKKDTE